MRVEQVIFVVCLLYMGVLVDLDLAECDVIVCVLFISNSYKQTINRLTSHIPALY